MLQEQFGYLRSIKQDAPACRHQAGWVNESCNESGNVTPTFGLSLEGKLTPIVTPFKKT
jgi:hypothetical protein